MPDQPWLPFYGDIPASIPYPDATLYELYERSTQEHSKQIVVEFLGERLSYRGLHRQVLAASEGLWALGVRPADRVGLLMPNMPHAMVLLYSANRIGAVLSLFHPEADPGTVSAQIADFDPTWMAVGEEHVTGLVRLLSGRTVRGLVVCSYADFGKQGLVARMQRMRRRLGVDTGGIRGLSARNAHAPGEGREVPPVHAWRSFLRPARSVELPPHREIHTSDEVAIVLYTGGSTGRTVGVMHTDYQLNAVAMQTQVQGPLLAGQSLLSVVPISHGYGIAVGIHATVSAGATSIMMPHFTPRVLAKQIRRRQPEYLVGVPQTYTELVFDRAFRRARHRARMGAFCGGDRLSRSVRTLFEQIVRRRGGSIGIREGYGLTETVTACATMPDSDSRPGTVGIPYPDTYIAIARPVDAHPVDGRDPPVFLGSGEVGEILVSGPTVTNGYWNREDLDAGAFHADSEDRIWLRTGDLGSMDSDGFLSFVERISASVTANGVPIHPGLAEIVLNEHAEVLEACVTTRQEGLDVSMTAHVAALDNDRDTEWLEQHLRESLLVLDPLQRPRHFQFHGRLPRTLGGAIDRRRLVDRSNDDGGGLLDADRRVAQ